MKLKMYSIYDTKTGIYNPPMALHNAAHAMRVHTEVFTGNNQFGKFPADYSVMEIGTYDDQTGNLEKTEHKLVCTGAELVAEAKKGS